MSDVLWYICTARKLLPFWSWAEQVNFVDKLIVKNYMKHDADAIAVRYFFKHKYEHLIISTDDILGSPDHVRLLLQDEEEHGFPVIGGWCNVDLEKGWSALSLDPADPGAIETKIVSFDTYGFLPMRDVILAQVPHQEETRRKYGWPFIRVWFTGLPLTLIRRETLRKVPFKPFRSRRDRYCNLFPETRGRSRGVQFDLQFALDCAANNIPIIVDTRIFLLHFGQTGRFLKLGKERRSIQLVKAEAT